MADNITPVPEWTPIPGWDDRTRNSGVEMNKQGEALANRIELVRDNQKRTPLHFATLAEASAAAATLPDGQIVSVAANQLEYTVQAGLLVLRQAATNRIDLRSFGAKGDNGVTNNKAAIEAAIVAADGKKTIWVPVGPDGGSYLVTSGTLTIPSTARFEYEAGAKISASGSGAVNDFSRSVTFFGGESGERGDINKIRGVNLQVHGNTGTASGSTLSLNRITIGDDTIDASPDNNGTKVDGLLMLHNFGGAGTKGGRHAIEAILNQTAITDADNPDRNYVGIAGVVSTGTGDGGIGIGTGLHKGGYFGCNFVATHTGGINILNLTGGEINTNITAQPGGNEVHYHSGLQIVNGGSAQGTTIDAALAIGTKAGAGKVPWRNAIRVGRMNGGDPLGGSSKILVADSGVSSIEAGFEIPKCSDAILRSGDVVLANSLLQIGGSTAGIEIGSQSVASNSFIDFHSSGNQIDYDSRIVASGGSSSVGAGTLAVVASSVVLQSGAEVVITSPRARPGADITTALGRADRRYTDLYIANAPTVTSDEREKEQWRDQTDSEKYAALEIKQSIKAFKFSDAVNAKGESARWHFGVGAQTVGDVMRSHGLDPANYAFWCYDEWEEQPELKDEEGNIVQEYRAAGNRYGIRYDELCMFILAAI